MAETSRFDLLLFMFLSCSAVVHCHGSSVSDALARVVALDLTEPFSWSYSTKIGTKNWVMVEAIHISVNRFVGAIPVTLGSCAGFQNLNLSKDVFQGPTPDSFDQLKSLRDFDLSFNNLSGPIPKSLDHLNVLDGLNLSSNNFTGEIPKTGAFAKFTAASFLGNPHLCGRWILFPACPTPTHKRDHSFLLKILLPIAAVGFFLTCCILLGFFRSCNPHAKRLSALQGLEQKLGYPRISYQEIVRATNDFSETNLLGTGNFGCVYKAVLSDGLIVAAKVINFQNEEAGKSFAKECEVLGEARHRNLLSVRTSFSNANDIEGLVLNLMSNGSLEKHLYGADACGLSLSERLNIAIGIAHGMAYLHQDCSIQIVHCDLKPSNVLLDMTAHVADFGIEQLISANSMDSVTTTHSSKGSIGYIAPEYGLGGRVSTKGDVYSYGVVLLEMIIRKSPAASMFTGGLNLREWVTMAFPDRILDLVDSSIFKMAETEQRDGICNCVIQITRIGLKCTRPSAEERPSMPDVVGLLEIIRETIILPYSPSL